MSALLESARMNLRRTARRAGDPMPRLTVTGGLESPARFRAVVSPNVPSSLVFARILVWLGALVRFGLGVAWDEMRGATTTVRRAARLRRVFESIGGTGIVAGQQLAMRLDVLPLEYASALAKLEDRMPPLPLSYAVERAEAAAGGPLSEVFETFDPKPIASTALSCIYQAVRRSGEKVAVKIRRPEAGRMLAAERLALDWILRWFTPFLLGHADVLKNIRAKLPQLLLENLDFTRAARLQRMFRRATRKDGLTRLSTPKVYIKLSSDNVVVSELVSGVWLSEVIAAQENGDEEALTKLRTMGINPSMCGRRLLHTCWWGFFENLFFCELPDPSQIVVTRKGRLVFIGLGDTSEIGWPERRILMTAMERLCEHDVEGAVSMLVQLLLPLPPIDVHELSKRIEARIWTQIFAMENRDSVWWERSSTAVWMALLTTAREYGISVKLNISRMIQSACTYDHVAARLWPKLRVLPEFRRYLRESTRRGARRVLRTRRKMKRRGEQPKLSSQVLHIERLLSQLNLLTQSIVETVPVQYLALAKKGAYSASQTVLAMMSVVKLAILAVGLRIAYLWYTGGPIDLIAAVQWVGTSPVFLVLLLLLFVGTARRIMFRLDDLDAND